jgi:nucleotidyltransferase substrate binding protein (TIGR01987 family)
VEELKLRQAKFLKSLSALEQSIQLSNDPASPILQNILVASNIKHFEMCYESAWKFLQILLRTKYDLKIDSPKKIFRELFALGLIDNYITTELLNISEARNATVHDYDEETAYESYSRIT